MTPYAQYKKSLDLLHMGHYQSGFRLYEFRWHPKTREASGEKWEKWVKAPKWNGERLYDKHITCLLYTSPSPRDYAASRMPSSA